MEYILQIIIVIIFFHYSTELEEKYNEKVKIAKLNIDRNKIIPKRDELTGDPTFMTFKEGKVVESIIGALLKKEVIKMILKVLS